MATLTIFANYFINDEERFLRLKDSFMSFKDINAQKWVINARGKYKLDVLFFLHDHLGDKLSAYVLESNRGWFHDSRTLIKEIDTDFVLFWIEDHINLVDVEKYDLILEEMKENNVDALPYTWYTKRFRDKYNRISKQSAHNIEFFIMDRNAYNTIQKHESWYIIGCCSIFLNTFFKKIINKNDPILKRWPKNTPFDFEKGPKDTHWLPFVEGIPKFELFASIDCEVPCYEDEIYCLQSRGHYPKRVTRDEEIELKQKAAKKSILFEVFKIILPNSFKNFIKRIKYTLE